MVRIGIAASLVAVGLALALIPIHKAAEDVSLDCGVPISTSFRSTSAWEQRESRREIQKLLDEHSPPGSINPPPGHLDVPPVHWVVTDCVSGSRSRTAVGLAALLVAAGLMLGPTLLAMRRGGRRREDHRVIAPAGWYADPQRQPRLRYWDGSAWTDHVRKAADQPVVEPTAYPTGPTPRRWLAISTALVFVGLAAILVLLPSDQMLYAGTNHPYRISCGNAISAAGMSESTALARFYQYGLDKIGLGALSEDNPDSVASQYAQEPSDYHQRVKQAASSCNSTGRTRLVVSLGLVATGVLATFVFWAFERRKRS
jgi:hypothetical protein